jgi:predicted kinase
VPTLVVVAGPPAAGKTVLAERLAVELRVPLLAKDDLKLVLYRALGASDMAESQRLGAAAFEVLSSTAARLLAAGIGVVLEGNFARGRSEAALLPLLEAAEAVQVHCAAAREETLRRYRSRKRHEMHFDEAALPGVLEALDSGVHDPMDLGVPTLRVDTTAGYDPPLEAILRFVRTGVVHVPARSTAGGRPARRPPPGTPCQPPNARDRPPSPLRGG